MRYIYSEAQNNYSNYLFSYQVYVLKEDNDLVDDIYGHGFLPVRSIKDLFYLSRSCRVDLTEFNLSSENRRVLKKLEGTVLKVQPIGSVKPDKSEFTKDYLNDSAIKRMLSVNGNFTDIFNFDNKGAVITKVTRSLIHYAHQFSKDKSIGMACMTALVNYAKNENKKHIYLGTCYGVKSLYKTQFNGFEFFDGISWSKDIDKLKYLVGKDGSPESRHLLQNEEYLERYYQVKKLGRLIKNLQK